MAKKGNSINGWLAIDKAPGMTSADVIRALKRILHPKKVGHAGTLDPMATGVLPVAFGEATKTIQFLVEARKIYAFTVQFGSETTTDDTEGEVINSSDARPTEKEIKAAMGDFIGEIEQVPPKFSAIKVEGKRAYDLARAGKEVDLKPRTVRVDNFDLLEFNPDSGQARFEVTCGKGTYIRAIARDLGRKLKCFGHITAIRRLAVGGFSEKCAISLEKLNDLSHSARALEALYPVMTALDDIPAVAVTKSEAKRAKQGQALQLPTSLEGMVKITCEGELIALAEVEQKKAKPVRVFNLT